MAKVTKQKDEVETVTVPAVSEGEKKVALATIKPADLKKLDELDKKIDRFRKEYSELKIEDENDHDGYEKVRLALGEMRPTRTGLETERKSITEPYRMATAYINSRYAEKTNAIAEIEAPLKARKKEIDEIEEERKRQAALDLEKKHNERIDALTKNGCVFDGEYYSIKDEELGIAEISLNVVDIRTMSDELYKNFLQQVMDKNALIISERERVAKEKTDAEAEQKRKDEDNRRILKEQQDKLDADAKKMQEQQDKLNEQMRQMKDQQTKFRISQLTSLGLKLNISSTAYVIGDHEFAVVTEDINDLESDQWDILFEKVTWEASEYKVRSERIQKRTEQVKSLGMEWKLERKEWWFEGNNISYTEMAEIPDDEWTDLLNYTGIEIQKSKAEIEEKRIAEEKRKEKEIADKAIAEQKEKERRQAEEKAAELAASSDKKKWEHLVAQFNAIPIPEMTSKAYVSKIQKIRDFFNSL